MIGAKVTCESLQLVQCPGSFKRLGIELYCAMGGEHTGASTSRLLGMGGVRCGIGPRKEFWVATRRGL